MNTKDQIEGLLAIKRNLFDKNTNIAIIQAEKWIMEALEVLLKAELERYK